MIITQTPMRVSLVGGGTDLPSFYEEFGPGRVVSFTISKYMYIVVNQKFDGRVRVSYSVTEMVETSAMIHHDIARECCKRMGISNGIEIVSVADVPGRGTGLGSSSAYAVGLLNALCQYRINYPGDPYEPFDDVAEAACKIEIEKCHKLIGKQDQYAVAYGGLNMITFYPDRVEIERIPLDNIATVMEEHLLLFWTGRVRPSREILTQQAQIRSEEKLDNLRAMANLASTMGRDLKDGYIDRMGELLHKNWVLKSGLVSGISDPFLSHYYTIARNLGAEGGKVCGAGGGGFMLFWVPPDRHESVKKGLGLQHVPFKIDPQGTRLYGDGK